MRRKLVIGNWKMHGSVATNKTLLDGILKGIQNFNNVDCAVCVPYPYLCHTQLFLQGTKLAWGAQNLCANQISELTGAVSAAMLVDFSCTYVILGHSERRVQLHETDETAGLRFNAALEAGLTPIFCMGESKEERDSDWTEYVVGRQLDSIIRRFGVNVLEKAVLAYEPLWAVGTGNPATPEQAQCVHHFIRQRIARCHADVASEVRILYGGSLKPSNAAQLFAMPDIDGGLIGGASLAADQFVPICKAANDVACNKS